MAHKNKQRRGGIATCITKYKINHHGSALEYRKYRRFEATKTFPNNRQIQTW